jgi:hypothetical protein
LYLQYGPGVEKTTSLSTGRPWQASLLKPVFKMLEISKKMSSASAAKTAGAIEGDEIRRWWSKYHRNLWDCGVLIQSWDHGYSKSVLVVAC